MSTQQGILKNIKYISFDVGFTLIYPNPPVGSVYANIARNFGYSLNEKIVQSRFNKIWRTQSSIHQKEKMAAFASEDKIYYWWKDIFKESLGIAIESSDLDEMFQICFQEYAKGKYWRLYPEILTTLSTLKDKGFQLIVLSNWDHRLLQTLNDLQLSYFFNRIYISTITGYTKPHPQAYQYILKDLGIYPQDIVHVGDSLGEDVKGALKADFNAVLLNRSKKNPPLSENYKTISRLSDILE